MNAFYAQSGGVTAVINASAAGVIETARKHKHRIGKVYAGRKGIIGAWLGFLDRTARGYSNVVKRLVRVSILCLVIVTLREDRPPTANLMSPVVVNLANRRAAQVIQTETGYSHQHSLAGSAQEAPC